MTGFSGPSGTHRRIRLDAWDRPGSNRAVLVPVYLDIGLGPDDIRSPDPLRSISPKLPTQESRGGALKAPRLAVRNKRGNNMLEEVIGPNAPATKHGQDR